jgi:hypothetical protein
MARIFLKRTLSGFEPADDEGKDLCRKYKVGEVYRADVVKPRSYQFHKLCMALISLTYCNLPEHYHELWPTPKKFRRMLADAIDHVDEFITKDGEVRRIPLSLSYDDVPDDVEFGRLFSAMMTVCAHLLGIADLRVLEAEVSKYADHHYGMAA